MLCCIVMPFCIFLVYLINQHSTRKLLREHKNEMRKFQTLSTSRTLTTGGHEYTYSHPTATHVVHRNETDESDDEVADGLYRKSKRLMTDQRVYQHIPQKQSLDGQYTIKMYNDHVLGTNPNTNGLSNAMTTAHTLAVPNRSPLNALNGMNGANQYIISPMESPMNQSPTMDSMDDDDDSYDRNGMRIRHHIDRNEQSTDTNELITRKRGDTVRTETGFTAETEDILKQFPLYDDAECMEYQEPMALIRPSQGSSGSDSEAMAVRNGQNVQNAQNNQIALDSQMARQSSARMEAELNVMRQRIVNQQSDLHRLVQKSNALYDSEMTMDSMTTMDDDGDGHNGRSHRDSLDLGPPSGSGRGVLVNETSSNVQDSHEELEAAEHDGESTNHHADLMSLNSITTYTQEMGSFYHRAPGHSNPESPGLTAISSLERGSRKRTDETSVTASSDPRNDYFVVKGMGITRAPGPRPGLIPLNSNSTATLTTATPTVHCVDQPIGANVDSTVSMLSTKSPRDSEMKQSVLDQHSTRDQHSTIKEGTHRTMVTVSTHFTNEVDEFAIANHSAFSTPEMHKGVRRHGPILPYVELPPLEQSRNGRDEPNPPQHGTELAREPTESEVPTLPPEYSQRKQSEDPVGDHDAFSETSNDKRMDDMYTINEHIVNTDDHVVDHEQTQSDGAEN